MRRSDFNHLIAAAAEVSGEREIVVIGSQAILGTVDRPPGSMVRSMEADIYPLRNPEKAIEIDANLGDGSLFHSTYGFYAHGVGPETAVAPTGWIERLAKVAIPSRVGQREEVTALCMETHDLVLAKCAAGRDRDWEFAREALEARLVQVDTLLARVDDLPTGKDDREHVRQMLEGIVSQLRRGRDQGLSQC